MNTNEKTELLPDSPLNDGTTLLKLGWCYDKLATTYSEAHRHECEILSMVRMYQDNGAAKVASFLLQVEKYRGTKAAERLRYETAARLGLGKKK